MSDSEDEEDYADYGTPLEPLEEDAMPRKKPFSLEDQVVRDKQGRRRFHGAFTGGFSAGFFNSVGSLEGWTPSTFKSSRSDKAGSIAQQPKDFMDDEDMDEHGIAPNVLRVHEDFSSKRGKKREHKFNTDGPIPGKPVLQELLQPVRDTVGVKLLKQMGWKPGQGIGPRLTHVEKQRSKLEQQKAAGKVYGCMLPDVLQLNPAEKDDESSSCDESEVTFAPDDFEPLICKTKDNCFGIGYVGLDKRPVLSSHINLFEPSFLNTTDKNKKVSIRGQAFGVGAFEEEDEDIYGREDMSQYDFALESTKRTSEKVRKQRWSTPNEVNQLSTCIEGFVISSQPAMKKLFFPPPVVPRTFQPVHVVRKSRFEPAPPSASTEVGAKKKGLERHKLTAEDRSHIIGEAVSTAAQQTPSAVAQDVPMDQSASPSVTDTPGKRRFRPFAAFPDKQQRYEKFLMLQKSERKAGLSKMQPLSMTEWERDHELSEFEQAARLYVPMTGIMSDRFVSATHADLDPLAVVEKTSSEEDKQLTEAAKMKMFGKLTRQTTDWAPSSLLCKRFNIPEPNTSVSTTSEHQKKTSKFSVFNFLEADQYNTSNLSVHDEEMKEAIISEVERTSEMSQTIVAEGTPSHVSKDQETTVINEEKKSSVIDFPDEVEKVDLFKAIFLSSSSEDDSDDDNKESTTEHDQSTVSVASDPLSAPSTSAQSGQPDENVVNPMTSEKLVSSENKYVAPSPPKRTPADKFNNIERNTSPSRGIFADLDLDAVNARKRDVSPDNSKSPKYPTEAGSLGSSEQTDATINVDLPDDAFGPRLPTNVSITSSSSHLTHVDISSSSEESDVCWIEKSDKQSSTHHHKEKRSRNKKHKKDKKASKHKHAKHKHKKKHKTKR